MRKRNSIVVLVLIIGIAAATGIITFLAETDIIKDMKLSLVHDNKIQQQGTDPKERTDTQTSIDTNTSDPSKTGTPVNSSSESATTDDQTKKYLFDIYSEKDNIEEAVKEIAVKYIEEVKDSYNESYIKEGVDQRMEDSRLTHVSEHTVNGYLSYENLVDGGTLTVYYIEFELKPKYPEKFTPALVIETLQESGWILMEGRELLIYHENNKVDAPYYLASVMLFDEFLMGKSPEQVLTEIVEEKIPQLKLLDYENFSYGDELAFYENDERSSKNPTAISVVNKFLEAMRKNDYDTWLSTMTDEKQKDVPYYGDHEFGVIGMDILDIHYETDLKYKYTVVNCEEAVKKGLTADNIAIIYALFDVKYDHTKIADDDGKTEWHFALIRKDKYSPWCIAAWGYGRRGI